MTEILVLCTANVCRSPMAAALLTGALAGRDTAVSVRSAGVLGDGERRAPPAPLAAAAMADRGLDISAHRSRQVGPDDLVAADLTLAMARVQLRHAVVLAPFSWPRSFTLKELVRRGEQIGPRPPGTGLAAWLARAHEGRSHAALLWDSADDDVADPIGGPPRAYAQAAEVISDLVGRLTRLCWPARQDG
jgi:protein-tyrosine phosphatase